MNKYKFTYKNTTLLRNIIFSDDGTKIQPIDRIMIDNKLIINAIYRGTVIYSFHMPAVFKLDISRISPDKLEGKKVYMNAIHVTDGLICARYEYNNTSRIIVSIGPEPDDKTTYIVCELNINEFGISVQNLTNSYNVYAEYNEGKRTLYLTDEAEEE